MRTVNFGRRWLGICLVAASLGACVGSQPPIGAPPATTHTNGSVYKVSLSGVHKVVYYFKGAADASLPHDNLIDVNGVLYGTTSGGGNRCRTRANHPARACWRQAAVID
jgi:hypothetical protein